MTDAEYTPALFGGLVRTRFDMFVECAFTKLNPAETFVSEDYVEALCFALQDVALGDERRLLVTMPPRHLKSFCASVALPAFALGHNPALKIAVASYGDKLGRDHAEQFRQIISSNWYRSIFPDFRLAERGDRFENFKTTQGGGRRAVSVGGAFTGFGAHLLILDDLIKANDVNSSVSREAVERFYTETALTRFDDPRNSRIISVQQRLHLEDIVARLIETGRYHHLNLPAIAERDMDLDLYLNDVWEWRAGDLLSPQRFPHELLDRMRDEMGSRAFAAQFLLDPQLAGGQLADWRRVQVADDPFSRDEVIFVVQSVDTALKAGDECDYSAVTTWGYNGEKWRLMHVFHARLEYPDLKSTTLALAKEWRADKILIEDAALGVPLAKELRQAGLPTQTWGARDGKAERLGLAMDQLYSGEIELCRNVNGFDDLRRELVGFPSALHDDIVDTISQFANWAKRMRMDELVARKHGMRAPRRRGPVRRPGLHL